MKAWVDKNNVITFRDDLDIEEARELYEMLGQAFDAGLESGYKQGMARQRLLTAGLSLTPNQRMRLRARLSRLGLRLA